MRQSPGQLQNMQAQLKPDGRFTLICIERSTLNISGQFIPGKAVLFEGIMV